MTKIRNILQTAMNREVIKTAPDMVIYLDGVPFIIHPYMTDKNGRVLIVNFNDYVTSVSTNYNIDQMIPSGTISLSVPNGSKQLFKAPGGGLILDVMSDVQIFAKSYFFSKKNNSVYRRIFNGLVKAVDYNEGNTSLEITLSIVGILHLFEMTRIALNPGLATNTSAPLTPFLSNQYNLNPIQAIRDTFVRGVDFSDVQRTALPGIEDSVTRKKHPLYYSLLHNYIDKWSVKLASIWQYVHIFGLKNMAKGEEVDKKTIGTDKETATGAITTTETDELFIGKDYQLAQIQKYTFDFAVGQINITNPTLTSRLERLRTLIDLTGYEGYQDLDGSIIFKPPLYNLDCTILGDDRHPELANENLREDSNPFIINLSEVLSESYSEDEAAIRRTRMTIQGNYNVNGIQLPLGALLTPVADYMDINLIKKFGIRDEAPKQMLFLTTSFKYNMAFAAAELAKINLGFRTYHVTIPMRPEIRLGFPIFIPHLDMYAYITSIGISYNVGNRADMNLTCNACRKRPQFPVPTSLADGTVVNVYESIPNLVHKWTTKDDASEDDVFIGVENVKDTPKAPPKVNSPSSNFAYGLLSTDEKTLSDYLTKKIGSNFEVFPTTPTANWRVQNDGVGKDGSHTDATLFGDSLVDITNETPAGKKIHIADAKYLDAIRHTQPYTDEKGYEVIGPFPWGRYAPLRDAIFEFTKGGIISGEAKASSNNVTSANAAAQETVKATNISSSNSLQNLNSVSPFLLSGLAAPNVDVADALSNPLNLSNEPTTSANQGTTESTTTGKESIMKISIP